MLAIDPEDKTVVIFRPSGAAMTLRSDEDLLDLGDVVLGFQCSLREIFE